jgi:hypothetical protein
MWGGAAQGEDGAPRVTRRVVRLLVLLGLAMAAYLALSLLDHAAWADAGSTDHIGGTDPVASVKAVAGKKAAAEPKSVSPKSMAAKVRPQRIHRPATKRPEVHEPKVQAQTKIHAAKKQTRSKIQASSARVTDTAQRERARTSKLRQPAVDAVRDAARPSLPELAKLPDAPQAEPPALPQLSALPQLPALPHVPGVPEPPDLSQLSGLPEIQVSAVRQLPGLPQGQRPVLTRTTVVHARPLPQPMAFTPGPGLSGAIKPLVESAHPRTTPLPASPRQPVDRSTSTGQARDSGGGNAPAMGTVSSSWRPATAAAGCCPATDLIARGRTVRYAGPPS